MKTITVTTAILLTLKEFVNDTFSIHDVTKNIRKNVRNGEYELVDYVDSVPHDLVKTHFLELIDNGLLDNYYVRNNPNGYREYCLNPTFDSVQPATADPTTVVQNAMATTVLPTDVQLKIYAYLKNNGPANMKRIQSRLKGYNYTCQEIKDFLDKINLIDPASSVNPPSQAYTVKF
jgi:hypothetical protein